MAGPGKPAMASFVVVLLYLLTGACGHFYIKTASSRPAGGASHVVSCSPNHTMLIRTARYLSTAARIRPPLTPRADEMTSEDVIKLYRHCQSSDVAPCDVSKAGVEKHFTISYICLPEPSINPCSTMTSETPKDRLSFLVDYSDHALASDVSCRCTLTLETPASNLTSLDIRALNFYEETRDEHETRENAASGGGTYGRGLNSGRVGPVVLIDTSDMRWKVDRKWKPRQWQIRAGNITSITLLFDQLQSTGFGRVWIDFQGLNSNLTSYCNFTSQPAVPNTTSATTATSTAAAPSTAAATTYPTETSQLDLFMMICVTCAAVIGLICLVVIPVVTVAKYRRSSRPRKQACHNPPPPPPESNVTCLSNLSSQEGEYCTISEVSSSRRQPGAANDPRDCRQRTTTETTVFVTPSEEEEKTGHRDNNDNKGGNSNDRKASPPSPENARPLAAVTATSPAGLEMSALDSRAEYGRLNHGPPRFNGACPGGQPGESAIYDRTRGGAFDEGVYQHLHLSVRVEPRVIDNVYDHAANVLKQQPPPSAASAATAAASSTERGDDDDDGRGGDGDGVDRGKGDEGERGW